MTSPLCDLCGERPLLTFEHAGRRVLFCAQCATELLPYAWTADEWSDFINWLDSPQESEAM